MINCLLSIIIPVYNAEKYIESCLDSILVCKFQDLIEIILIDDGSTDRSLELMKLYEKKIKIINVFSQKNKGASEARNRGLKEAKGLYIWYVDSDDRINWKGFDSLIPILRNDNLDILLFNFMLLYPNGKLERYGMFDLPNTDIETGVKFFTEQRVYLSPWNKIFKREFLIQNNLWFIPDIFPEDMELMVRCFLYAKRVQCIALDLYFWQVTPNSLSKRDLTRYLDGYIRMLKMHFKLARRYPVSSFWLKDYMHIVCDLNNKITDTGKFIYLKEEQKIIRKIIREIPITFSKEYFILLSICVNPYLFFKLKHLKR